MLLRDVTNAPGQPPAAPSGGAPRGCSQVRPIGAGQAVPWADLGKLRLGQSRQHGLVVHNPTDADQLLTVALPDEGFQVVGPGGKAGVAFSVPARGSTALTLTFTPQKEGRVRAVLVFRFGDGSEAGRLAVAAAVVGAGGISAPPAALARPALGPTLSRPALRTAAPAAPQPHGEKRLRAGDGLATPREPPALAAPGPEQATPSVQPAKKARDGSGRAAPGPAATAAAAGPRGRAPDPATPRLAVMRHREDRPPGSVEEATPGSMAPAVPRLQLGNMRSSPGSLGSSRFAQQLAGAQAAPLVSSRLGGASPPQPVSRPASAGTFTHFHTNLWMDKQEVAFKAWLNTILLPAAAEQAEAGQGALASRRLTAKMRGLLWRIYQRDEQFRDVMLRVEERVMGGKLRMRDEEACLKNLKDQAKVREVLLSYHPFWLRLGMEVVVNRVAAGGDAVASAADLELFLRDWFLRDPDLAKNHAPNKAVNGLHTKAYWVQLGQLVLSRLLLLVALLDRAMAAALPQGVPLLFSLRSKLKGSGQVLQAILPAWLAGEGDVLRSLARLGYKLQYEQQPKREISFAVSNLAVDLRDGLRLCKLADILKGTDGLFEQARFPADKRPVKLHNVQLALGEFTRSGCSLDGMKTLKGISSLQPVDVIDGDREKTLHLLWRLILHFQLPQLVSPAAVRIEIDRITGTAPGGPGAAAASDSQGHVSLLLQWTQAVCAHYNTPVPNFTVAFADGHLFCLLINFYLGNAYLPMKEIYVPDAAAQQPVSPSSGSCSDEDDAEWQAMHNAQAPGDPAAAARHRQGVAHNFDLVHRVAEALGSIPVMVSATDILEHGPDEKAVVLFTAFLCNRLMEMSKEERAAMVMQRLWRQRALHKPGTARAHLHRWIAAASVIQRAARAWLLRRGLQEFAARRRRCFAAVARLQAIWRGRPIRRQYLEQRRAAMCIQAAFRGKMERRRVFQELVLPQLLVRALERKREVERSRYQGRLLAAAVSVQALRRGSVQRREFLRMRRAAVAVQAAVRCHQAASSFQQLRGAAVVLQTHWRRRQALLLLRQIKAVVVIQKHYRGHAVRSTLALQHSAATTIQAAWRAHSQQQRYQQQRQGAIAVQAAFRSWAARRRFCRLRESTVAIQRHWRGYAARRDLEQQHKAATCIQAAVRMQQAHKRLLQARGAATVIQSAWRGRVARQLLQRLRAAVVLQSAWHARQARLLLRQHKAAREVQRVWRGHCVRSSIRQQAAAAVRLQAAWHRRLARHRFLQQRAAAVAIQAAFRRYAARSAFLRQQAAATAVQAAWRGHLARQLFQRMRAAVVLQSAWRARQARLQLRQHRAAREMQRVWRGHCVRSSIRQQAAAAVRLQAAWRCHATRAAFMRQRQASIVLQAAFRRHTARSAFLQQRAAATAIQAAWRGFAARRWLRQTQAATVIQRHARGFLVRRQVAREQAAAVLIQRRFREHLDWKRQQAIEAMTRQMRELARTMQLYHQRMAAALRIQAVWRGHMARVQYAQMVREHQERLRLQAEKEAAARAVIAPWAATFRDRTWFLRARKASRVLQRWWRKEYAARAAAAVTLQAAARRFLAVRQLQKGKEAATLIQAVWRGHHVRTAHPKAKRFAELRKRLARAYANAVGAAHTTLAARTRVGLEGLLSATHLSSAAAALETLALCMEASRGCCDMVAAGGGSAALLRLVQSAGRDKSAQEGLRWALLCLAHLCRYRQYAEEVFGTEGLLALLGDQLQQHRDKEEVFLASALLLQRLVADAPRALALSRMPEVLGKYEGVARLLALRLAQEQKYLLKLEGQKGSDVSARQSTRALVSLTRQLTAIQRVLTATGAPPVLPPITAPASPAEQGATIGKNTIVRRTLAELQGQR